MEQAALQGLRHRHRPGRLPGEERPALPRRARNRGPRGQGRAVRTPATCPSCRWPCCRASTPSIEKDVYDCLSLRGSLNARNTLGGTAPAQVRRRWRGTGRGWGETPERKPHPKACPPPGGLFFVFPGSKARIPLHLCHGRRKRGPAQCARRRPAKAPASRQPQPKPVCGALERGFMFLESKFGDMNSICVAMALEREHVSLTCRRR